MAHELDMEIDGTVRMAYNADRGTPWHKLGVPVEGLQSIEAMLMASGADYEVVPRPLYVVATNGDHVAVDDKYATTRTVTILGDDGFQDRTDILGVVGTGYEIEQNSAAAQFALDCVGASGSDAVIDTMGVLKNGTEFFTYLRLEPLYIDPRGVNDMIERGLCVRTAHNGSMSLMAYPTNTRVVCWNTATMSMQNASNIVRIRHTKNMDSYKKQAVQVLGVAEKLRGEFVRQAESLLGIPATFSDVRNVANALWGVDALEADATQRSRTIYDNRIADLSQLWISEKNSGGYGMNRWSAWNTITEFIDHGRDSNKERAAIAAMSIDGGSAKLKAKAHSLLSV